MTQVMARRAWAAQLLLAVLLAGCAPGSPSAQSIAAKDLGRGLANSREWPVWKEGSEFKAARDATAQARR